MRVFKLADGTSWIARLHDGAEESVLEERVGWEAILIESDPVAAVQRLVYRPSGWLSVATPADLATALEEAHTVRSRWGA